MTTDHKHHTHEGEDLDALRKDAERYRWLCANNFDRDQLQVHTWVQWTEPHSATGEPQTWSYRVRGGALDRVIDQAMREEAEDTRSDQ